MSALYNDDAYYLQMVSCNSIPNKFIILFTVYGKTSEEGNKMLEIQLYSICFSSVKTLGIKI